MRFAWWHEAFAPRVGAAAEDGTALALRLLDTGVATVPCSAFGMPAHLRLSFATDQATLVEGGP